MPIRFCHALFLSHFRRIQLPLPRFIKNPKPFLPPSINYIHEHDHHHHNYDESLPSPPSAPSLASLMKVRPSLMKAQKRVDTVYKPRVGEILAKDSALYGIQQTPITELHQPEPIPPSMLRRNYWPLVDNTVTKLAVKAVAGANALKNLLHVNLLRQLDNANMIVQHKKNKLRTILWAVKQHPLVVQKHRLIENLKPPIFIFSKTRPMPTTTISEDYVHTFDNKVIPGKGRPEKNPYADMGVTSFKHFEDTILRELEEKEERKVEATLHTLYDDKYILEENLLGAHPSDQDWTPLQGNGLSVENPLFSTAKPYAISPLHTNFGRPFNDIRPVCEHIDEHSLPPTLFLYPQGAESQHELQQASNENTVTASPAPGTSTSKRVRYNLMKGPPTTEHPNYPDYFLKKQQKQRGGNRHPSKNVQQKNNNQTTTVATTTVSGANKTTTATAAPPFSALLFHPVDKESGFKPIIAKTNFTSKTTTKPKWIKASTIKAPATAATTTSTTTIATTTSQRTTSTTSKSTLIHMQASNVVALVVASPRNNTTRVENTQSTRKTPKKTQPKQATTTAKKNTEKPDQKLSRGTIKFSDSL